MRIQGTVTRYEAKVYATRRSDFYPINYYYYYYGRKQLFFIDLRFLHIRTVEKKKEIK